MSTNEPSIRIRHRILDRVHVVGRITRNRSNAHISLAVKGKIHMRSFNRTLWLHDRSNFDKYGGVHLAVLWQGRFGLANMRLFALDMGVWRISEGALGTLFKDIHT